MTRLTMCCRAGSASATPGGMRASEFAPPFRATTIVTFYPNGYSGLTQRLASTAGNHSDQCHDHLYFHTIDQRDIWPTGCKRSKNGRSWDSDSTR
jgi:hypothetical protein